MKKYILGLMIMGMLAAVNTGIAMKKKEMPATALSSKQVAELRKAVENYKKNIAKQHQEKIIDKYENDYPNDSFVKAKMNEITRFDNPVQSHIKQEPVAKQPITRKDGESNLLITNKSGNTIELSIHRLPKNPLWKSDSEAISNGKIAIQPRETVSTYVPEAEQGALRMYVYDSKGRMQKGIDQFEPLKKGQVVDLIYNNNSQYRERMKDDGVYIRGSYVNHLYEIRNGKTLNHNDDIYTSPISK